MRSRKQHARMVGLQLICFVGAFQTVVWGQAPVPKLLREAKRVYLVNAGTQPKILDEFAGRLLQWSRFKLVDSRTDADVVIAVADSSSGRSTAVGVPVGTGVAIVGSNARAIALEVRSPNDPDPLYSDIEEHGVGRDEVKNLVSRLCYKVEGQIPTSREHPCRQFGAAPR